MRGNNDFEVSKNLARYRFENNFVDHQNNYAGYSSMLSNAAKTLDILTFSVIHNYLNAPQNYFHKFIFRSVSN